MVSKLFGLMLLVLSQGVSAEYWTYQISEESPNQVTCRDNYAMAGIACSGSYCDNISILCRYVGHLSYIGWSNWFSEEQGGEINSYAQVNGIKCRGRYCDDVAIRYNHGPAAGGDCYDTRWVSDETQPAICSAGYTVSGVGCRGRYCDDMQLTCCR